jgi:hypothetical protein
MADKCRFAQARILTEPQATGTQTTCRRRRGVGCFESAIRGADRAESEGMGQSIVENECGLAFPSVRATHQAARR